MQEELIESKDGKSNFAGESFLAAAKLHCRAKLAEAEAKIELYLGDSVGIISWKKS